MEYLSGVKLRRELPEGSYLRRLPPVRYLMAGNELRFDRPVTFLVGENGSGKSTLLEAIAVACGFNPEGGTRNFRFATRETHSELGEYLTPIRKGYPRDGFFLRAESFYNVASSIDEMDEGGILGPRVIDSYGGVSLHRQSHGESFLALVKNRFGGEGLYLLDEPEAALSPSRARRTSSRSSMFSLLQRQTACGQAIQLGFQSGQGAHLGHLALEPLGAGKPAQIP